LALSVWLKVSELPDAFVPGWLKNDVTHHRHRFPFGDEFVEDYPQSFAAR